ncbi:hypothetical protein JW933_01710 [candidate division FCPU426 bacterium]|nr:hypothetical protein [candidate division FCPU426 bacterium]
MKKSLLLFGVFFFCMAPGNGWALNLIRIGENAVLVQNQEVQDAVVVNGSLEIQGRVLGNAVVLGGDATLKKTAYIRGDVVCLGGQILSETGAIVTGSKVEIGGKINWKSLPFFSIMKIFLYSFLYKISTAVILLALSIFFVLMWPNQIRLAAEEASSDLVKSTLVGIFTVALLIPLSIGFAITLFGLPIAFALFVFLLVASWFGVACMSYLVGTKISKSYSPVMAVIIGLLVLKFVHFVPFIGTVLYFLAVLPGLGAILLTRFGTNKPWLGDTRAKLSRKH